MDQTNPCIEQPALRDLPRAGWQRLIALLKRAMLLRCPVWGARGIFGNPWELRRCCPRCGYLFTREDGYFLGAYALNLIVSEIFGVGAILVVLLRSDLSLVWQQAIAVCAAIALPVLFYPFSRTLWMTLDLMVRSESGEEHVRAGDML